MSKEALHELIDKVDEREIEIVYYLLSRIVQDDEEVTLLPDEVEAFKEYEEAKARGEKFLSHEEVWGEKSKTKVA